MPKNTKMRMSPDAVIRVYKARMLEHAFLPSASMKFRTIAVMEKNKIKKRAGDYEPAQILIDIIHDKYHPLRAKLSPGPLVSLMDSGDTSKRTAYSVAELLYSESPATRIAGLTYFKHLGDEDPMPLSPGTLHNMEQLGDSLASAEDVIWRTAAITLADQISDDYLLNLAAVRQCLLMRCDELMNEYLPRIFSPALSWLDTFLPLIYAPSEQREKLGALLDEIVRGSKTIQELLQRYHQLLGHLPLGAEYSLGNLIREWTKIHGVSGGEWDAIWAWADKSFSATAEYHACQSLLANPALVAGDCSRALWGRILGLIERGGVEGTGRATPLRMVDILARYYTDYLECNIPGIDGERSAVMGLWFASRVQSVFGKTKAALGYLAAKIQHSVGLVGLTWKLSTPPVGPSVLRQNAISDLSLWESSLLCAISKNIGCLALSDLSDERLGALDASLLGNLKWIISPEIGTPKDQGLYLVGGDCFDLVTHRAGIDRLPESRAQITECLDLRKQFADPAALMQIAGGVKNGTPEIKLTAAVLLDLYSQMNALPFSDIWPLLNDEQWRKDALVCDDSVVPELMLDALLNLQVKGDDKCRSELPHLLAITCEQVSSAGGKEFLFLCLVASAISTGNISAIERLLKGEARGQYQGLVDHWRNQLSILMPTAPGWIAGRMRVVMASLYLG